MYGNNDDSEEHITFANCFRLIFMVVVDKAGLGGGIMLLWSFDLDVFLNSFSKGNIDVLINNFWNGKHVYFIGFYNILLQS